MYEHPIDISCKPPRIRSGQFDTRYLEEDRAMAEYAQAIREDWMDRLRKAHLDRHADWLQAHPELYLPRIS